jgi:hypothetical protein
MDNSLIVPNEIKAILNRAPVKLSLLQDDSYIAKNNLKFVTSPNIFEPNSTKFHPLGLFSEEIFGKITSMERFVTEAAIRLNTKIIHPVIFETVIHKKALYSNILSGKQYAVWNDELNAFELSTKDNLEAGTGYQFFMEYIDKLGNAESTKGLRAVNTHKLLSKYTGELTITNLICIPAGLRDIDMKSSRLSKDDINKIYMSIINLTTSLSSHTLSEDSIFDGIRYQIQLRVADIYEYIMNIISDKGGFLQKHYGARKIAFSTRNVISVAVNEADDPDDPRSIRSDETIVPMLNLIKCFQPFFVNYVMKQLYGELFTQGSTERVPVTNPATMSMEYITLKAVDINKYTTVEGITKILNQFKYVNFREQPVSIRDINGKDFWLIVTYTHEDKIFLGKTKEDIEGMLKLKGIPLTIKNIRPLYWTEALYIAGYNIVQGKHAFITRYPALGDGSIYPCKVHPVTTNPSKSMTVIFDSGLQMEVPHFPQIGSPYYESLVLHPSRLPGLGADHDGDVVSLSAVWTDEGNAEIANSLSQITSVIGTDLKLKIGAWGDVTNLVIHNLSRQDIQP